MTTKNRWKFAQHAESEYWEGITKNDESIEHVLETNRNVAARIRAWIPAISGPTLEIGVGGLGIGTLGFLKELPLRIGLDPLPLPPLSCTETLRNTINSLRDSVHVIIAAGENMPFADNTFNLVLCCNVLDHVHDPQTVIAEGARVLASNGFFYLEVDVFSALGLVKWHLWTKHRRKKEILVRAHPHRFREKELLNFIQSASLRLINKSEQPLFVRLFGRSWRISLFAQKSAI